MTVMPNRSVARFAGHLATILLVVTIVLQLLLAMGVLPISMAWGGRQTALTTGLRLASLAAVVILALFAYVIRRRAGLTRSGSPSPTIKVFSWLITAYLLLNTLGNVTSLSVGEKLLFGPISLLLALSCLVVSLSKSETGTAGGPDDHAA